MFYSDNNNNNSRDVNQVPGPKNYLILGSSLPEIIPEVTAKQTMAVRC